MTVSDTHGFIPWDQEIRLRSNPLSSTPGPPDNDTAGIIMRFESIAALPLAMRKTIPPVSFLFNDIQWRDCRDSGKSEYLGGIRAMEKRKAAIAALMKSASACPRSLCLCSVVCAPQRAGRTTCRAGIRRVHFPSRRKSGSCPSAVSLRFSRCSASPLAPCAWSSGPASCSLSIACRKIRYADGGNRFHIS